MGLEEPQHESANIITHKHPFIQPNFLEFPKETEIAADSHTLQTNKFSEIQQSAFTLHDIGLNPFPLPIGRKGGYPWKKLQYTRLDRDDEQYGLQMLFSGQCNIGVMCGRTSRNLFVIDCESPASLHYHIAQMQKRNIPLWVAETQRGGHIYLLCADGEVTNIPTGILPDAEIKGSNGYVLAPPSVHPSRKRYTWIHQDGSEPPTVSITQLDWLYDTFNNRITLEAHQSKPITNIRPQKRPYSPLSRRTRNYILNGHTISEGSRNNELFSASCDMAGNNFSQADVFNTLFPPAHTSGLSTHEIQATIQSAFSQPRTPAKPQSSQSSTNDDWQWAILFADHHQWQGRTATSQRAIFTALIHRAKVSSNEDGLFRGSIREIALLARKGTGTVQRILKDFQSSNHPYIIKCGYDRTSNATLWKFPEHLIQTAKQLNIDTLKESPQWLSSSVSVLSLPDSVERSGLGYNGLLVYRAMVDYGKAILPKALSEWVDLAPHQVKYALKKLQKHELVYRTDEGWCAHVYDDEALDMKVQQKKNIIGKGQRRAQRFAKERSIYAGRQLFYARMRYERDLYKLHVYETLRQINDIKFNRQDTIQAPVYYEIVYKEESCEHRSYRRVPLADLDDDDLSWIDCALSLGAEVYIQAENEPSDA